MAKKPRLILVKRLVSNAISVSRGRSVLLDVVPLLCQCPDSVQPVCGEDGLTYDNRCAANCM